MKLGDDSRGLSTPVDEADEKDKPAASRLRYRWKAGETYMYFFTVEAEVGDSVEEVSGATSYTVGSPDDAFGSFDPLPEVQEGTGTGFLVHSDGYLLTCAHVVEGATEIKVRLGDTTHTGQLVALDEEHDLALVRVSAGDLPALPLGESEAVELAQEVRAVGFPLSDVLGESVKITRGTIAGVVEDEGVKLFQIDASINPGNSGGPLVNEKGEVVGIASAKLTGEEITNVGFAVPANDAKRLLESKGVAFQATGVAEKLDGPALARRVTPSVALLSVTAGPGGAGSSTRFALRFQGHFSTSSRSKEGLPGLVLPSRLGGMTHTSGKIVVDELGRILDAGGEEQLPYLLGPPEALPIERLSGAARKSWRNESALMITLVEEEEQSALPALPGLPRPPGLLRPPRYTRPPTRPRLPGYPGASPFSQPSTSVITFPAMERSVYELVSSSEETAIIQKRYELTALKKSGGSPVLEMAGEGRIVFNKKAGAPESIEFKATLTRPVGNVTLRIPLKVTCRKADPDQLAQTQKPAPSRPTPDAPPPTTRPSDATAKPSDETTIPRAPATRRPSPPVSDIDPEKELDRRLKDLQSPEDNWSKRYQALSALAGMAPIEARREEVARILEPWLTDSNSSLRTSALRAIGVWGTKQSVPTLLKLLEDEDRSVRRRAIEALGKIPDERGAETLAELVKDPSDRSAAVHALRGMGPIAEDAVLKLLGHEDYQVRYEACHVLGEIGGPKSIAALKQQIERDTHQWSRAAADVALRRLESRH